MAKQDTKPSTGSLGLDSSAARAVLTVLLFAGAFCVLQRLTFLLRVPPLHRAPFWTPGALIVTALLLEPPRRWWIYYIGLCLGVYAAFFNDSVIPVAAGMLAAQLGFGAAALAAWAIRRFGGSLPFMSTTSLLVFVAFVILPVPVMLAAPVDLVNVHFGADDAWSFAVRSVLTGALGLLIATPALTLTLANAGVWLGKRSWSRIAEIGCLAAGLVTVGHFVFGRFAAEESLLALLYAPLPLLLWVAMRFELAGVGWALLVFGFQSTWNVMHGRGPFVSQSPEENILQVQLFLLAISLPLMFLAVMIQERRHASSALYETQLRLSHAARLAIVGELTASIAHEINQPLGAILSNADAAEMLLDSAPASLPEVRQILNDIRKDDLRASEVIRRLRALLRKREMELEPVDLNEIVLEVVALTGPESRRRGITIETELAANLPLVRGDNVHLQQILLNLLLNGMEAMADVPGAKTLSVRTALNGTSVEIAVMDLGSGIGPDRLTQLFAPFFSTKNNGLGLGLSIARSLVEAHGGRIWADNNPDGGATFRFTLPVEVQLPTQDSSDTRTTSLELIQ